MKTKPEKCAYCGQPLGKIVYAVNGKHYHGDERNCLAKHQDGEPSKLNWRYHYEAKTADGAGTP